MRKGSNKPGEKRVSAKEFREKKFQQWKTCVEAMLKGEENDGSVEYIEDFFMNELEKRELYIYGFDVLVRLHGGMEKYRKDADEDPSFGKVSLNQMLYWAAKAARQHEHQGEWAQAAKCYEDTGMNSEAERCFKQAGQNADAERCHRNANILNRKRPNV